jgi:hypothetical protein
MPRPVIATLTAAEGEKKYPFNQANPARYVFTILDNVSAPMSAPYSTAPTTTVTFPSVPEGTWNGTARMQMADGTFIGPTAAGQVTVPPDDIALNEPVTLALAVA